MRAFGAVIIAALLWTTTATAQVATPPLTRDTVQTDSVVVANHISPRTAFIRSLLIPGWGQFSVGSHIRGGVFVGLQSTSGFMLVKTIRKLNDAKDMHSRARTFVRDSLVATGEFEQDSTPQRLEAAIAGTRKVRDAQGLVNARKQQRQDWIAYTIVFTLASGIDALVAAHLADFPERIEVAPTSEGGMSLGYRLPTSIGR